MDLSNYGARAVNKYRRLRASWFARRPLRMANDRPLVSFTFDDIPRSSFLIGGAILKELGVRGTFYISLGLMDGETSGGRCFSLDDLKNIIAEGHEIGCHTHGHVDAWEGRPGQFEASILDNQRALDGLFPGKRFTTFAYPLSEPRPRMKRIAARHFACARGGGQICNAGVVDLNLLNACFIDHRNRDVADDIFRLIAENRRTNGWLIFGTHDVASPPSPYGCSPDLFRAVVRASLDSGAEVVPVVKALGMIGARPVPRSLPL